MNHIVKRHIRISAAPGEVWQALTDPAKTKKYFFHCEVFSDWKPGSTITFEGRLFLVKKIELTGKIIDVIPGKLLKYTLANGKNGEAGYSTVTDELKYVNGETLLCITDDVGTEEGAEKRFERSFKGWSKVLKGLKKLVEKEHHGRRSWFPSSSPVAFFPRSAGRKRAAFTR